MPRGGRPDPSPPGGIPPPRTDAGSRWQTETPPANKFVAAMQRVKHFAEEEVGQRVVAYGARVESQLQARRGVPGTPGGPAAGSGAVASSEKPGRRRAGKGPATLPESEPVPGDGARLGASRDHTDLFTRLRATAIFIRETEAAARAADAREASARNGEDPDGDGASSSSLRDEHASDAANEDDRDTSGAELSGSTLAIVASAEALRVTKRAVEHSLLPQYVAFADSLSAAAAKARAARWTAGTPAGAASADAAQADVETHLATLLLVETELQQALKKLKMAHVRASAINLNDTENARDVAVKKSVVAAHALARESFSREFKAARDRVGAMLVGNEAAKVVSQQRLLRAADAAYADLEKYYAAVARVRAECVAHPAFTSRESTKRARNARSGGDGGDGGDGVSRPVAGVSPEDEEDASRAREGAAVLASLAAAAAAARGALRAAYEDASAVKREAGAGASSSPDADPFSFASPLGGTDNSWRAHIAALDAELARGSDEEKEMRAETSRDSRDVSRLATFAVLPAWDASLDDDEPERDAEDGSRAKIKQRGGVASLGMARREREAARCVARRRALRDAARRAAASAATEYVRGALRNAVDAVEDATRACAAHAAAVAKTAESPAGPGVGVPETPVPPGTPSTPKASLGRGVFGTSPSSERVFGSRASASGGASGAYPSVPDVKSRIVGLGSLGRSGRAEKQKLPRQPGAPLAVPANGWPGSRAEATPMTPMTPMTPGMSARVGYGFARTTSSLVPVKERTAALFQTLGRIGFMTQANATASASANASSTRATASRNGVVRGGPSSSAAEMRGAPAPGGTGGGGGGSGWRQKRRAAGREPSDKNADDVASDKTVVGPLARLKLWAKGLRAGGRPRERAERSSRYDEIAARHRQR